MKIRKNKNIRKKLGRDPTMGRPCCRHSIHETKKNALKRRNSKEYNKFWETEIYEKNN